MRKDPCVYILASCRNGTVYLGVTSDIAGRVSLHKQGLIEGFTRKYGVHRLVYGEFHDTMDQAIAREKRLKRWRRAWKVDLIERSNPAWKDLYWEISGLVEV
jgi:putative endonuclease